MEPSPDSHFVPNAMSAQAVCIGAARSISNKVTKITVPLTRSMSSLSESGFMIPLSVPGVATASSALCGWFSHIVGQGRRDAAGLTPQPWSLLSRAG